METPTGDDVTLVADESEPARAGVDRPLGLGDVVGRYAVLSALGAGGMGVVYAAYDPELDRKVALKLLHDLGGGTSGTSGEQTRLLREARAMARLSHPNVMVVHDVGMFGDRVFVAMEFVDGDTLGAWLAEGRGRDEILRVFIDAGRGLEAAHEAGLIHRDFKPDNVMIGKDGRVRVMDFGLARGLEGAPPIPSEAMTDEMQAAADPGHADSVTVELGGGNGTALAGTPAYMAPEQHLGMDLDAATDQFAYCVALYEALYGERPFAGDGLAALAMAVTKGEVREPPRGSDVPARLRRVLLRGLAVDRSDRWPALGPLLAELARDPAAKRNRMFVGVAFVALAAVAGGLAMAPGSDEDLCAGGHEELKAAWSPERRAALESALVSSEARYAHETWERVRDQLDDYGKRWVEQHTSACEDANVRKTQSVEVMDLRMTCLVRARKSLTATVDVLAGGGAGTLERAVSAVRGLPPLERCADPEFLMAQVRPPDDPSLAEAVERSRDRLTQVLALETSGKIGEARAIADALATEARAQPYLPLTAEVLFRLGQLQKKSGDYAIAESTLEEAFTIAVTAGHDDVAAHVAMVLADLAGVQKLRKKDGERWGHIAEAEIARGKLGPLAAARLHVDRGNLASTHGDMKPARQHYEAARAIYEEEYGAMHPDTAKVYSNLGLVEQEEDNLTAALQLYERAATIEREALGPSHPEVGATLINIGSVNSALKNLDAAADSYTRARQIFVDALGADHHYVGLVDFNLALLRMTREEYRAAGAAFEHALPIIRGAMGPHHPQVGMVLDSLGDVHALVDEPEAALEWYRQALDAHTGGDAEGETTMRAYSLTGMGEQLHVLGRAAEALPLLEEALTIREADPSEPARLAFTRFVLARVLWDLRRDRRRARALAEQARDAWRGEDDHAAEDLAAVEAWLMQRG